MLLFVGLAAVVLYVLLLGSMWVQQERIVFQPPPISGPIAARTEATAHTRQVPYRAEDGTELFAFLIGDVRGTGPLLLAFHGNADLARNLISWASMVWRTTGVPVLLPELRGYDGLMGRPTYLDAAHDARAAHRYALTILGVARDRVAIFGHSLGSAIATELAAEQQPASLILQSPFTSARAMARRMRLPGLTLFWRAISRVHYDTVSRVRTLPAPVYVAHGERDMIVPVSMGQSVYEAAAVKGEILLVPAAGHNDVAERAPVEYWSWLRQALLQR